MEAIEYGLLFAVGFYIIPVIVAILGMVLLVMIKD